MRCRLISQLSIQVAELFLCELVIHEMMVQSAGGAEANALCLLIFPLMHVNCLHTFHFDVLYLDGFLTC